MTSPPSSSSSYLTAYRARRVSCATHARSSVRTHAKLPDVSGSLSMLSGGATAVNQPDPASISELASDVVDLVDTSATANGAARELSRASQLEQRGNKRLARMVKSSSFETLSESAANATTLVADSVQVASTLHPAKDFLGPFASPVSETAGVTAAGLGVAVSSKAAIRAAEELLRNIPRQRKKLARLEERLRSREVDGRSQTLAQKFLKIEGERVESLDAFNRMELGRAVLGGLAAGLGGSSKVVGALHLSAAAALLGSAALPFGLTAGALAIILRGNVCQAREKLKGEAERTVEEIVSDSGEENPPVDAETSRQVAQYLGVQPDDLKDPASRRTLLDLHLGPFGRSWQEKQKKD